MDRQQRRVLEYAGSATIVAGLCYLGFFYTVEADYMTLLSAANIQVESAQRMPAETRGSEGQLLRGELLDRATDLVDRAEASEPGHAQACEMRAYIMSLRGQPIEAAALYAQAMTLTGSGPEMRDDLLLNQLRALCAGDRSERALEIIAAAKGTFLSQNETAVQRVKARALWRSGRKAAARALAIEIQAADESGGSDSFFAGKLLEDLGDFEAAAAAYEKAANREPTANYYLGRLKIRGGQYDRGVEMLERAVSDARRTTLRLLERDRELWSRHVGVERLRTLTEPSGEAVTPGR